MKPERIPLFPLEVVLFPGTSLPLHIFEPRYRLMISHCLEHHREFGVVLTRAQGLAAVGCTAEILKVVKKYDDGRMDILTIGRAAFRVTQIFEEQPYHEGAVEYLEERSSGDSTDLQEKLAELYAQCHEVIYGREPDALEVKEGSSLAFQVSSELPLELEEKQALLEIREEGERERWLLERLEQWLPQLTHIERMRGRAVGNGHGFQ